MKLPLHRADPVKNNNHYINFFLDWAKRRQPTTTMGCTASKPKFENIDQRVVELVRYTKGSKVRPYTLRTAVSRRGYRISQNPLRGYF
jgi:hypothetical protein